MELYAVKQETKLADGGCTRDGNLPTDELRNAHVQALNRRTLYRDVQRAMHVLK